MNESLLLLPKIETSSQKIVIFNGAINLLNALRAHDEALDFAERIYSMRGDDTGSYAACLGLASKVETQYLGGNKALARTLVPDAIEACDANKNKFVTLTVRALAAIDLIDSGNSTKGLAVSLSVLSDFAESYSESDYVIQLNEAVARAYLNTGSAERAERFGLRAFERAQSSSVLVLQEKTSSTMAAIKRAQGQSVAAMGYYDINLALKDKLLEDRSHKNLAYERVKFDAQDKANQMALLQQRNKNLNIETALQRDKYQNLVLTLTSGLVAFTALGAWLLRTLRQKNSFRKTAQIDGLTQVSNRAHFTHCAQKAFNVKNKVVSLILFDMDFFKKINDTYGHPTGDWVLKAVCHTVKRRLPKNALLGRMGGEEFAICLPTFSKEEALTVAERCRKAIAAVDTRHSSFSFQMTASFGVATRAGDGSFSFEQALVAADKALYFSKNEGRNRVTAYQHSDAFQP